MSSAAALTFAGIAACIAQGGYAVRLTPEQGRSVVPVCGYFLAAGLACLILRGA